MPIYEYACRDCGHQFECLVRGDEKPLCPSCGQSRLTKQLSVPAAHTSATAKNTCPVQESCGVTNCCGKGCGMSEWM
jgi:putative FmdB family regulatory protein